MSGPIEGYLTKRAILVAAEQSVTSIVQKLQSDIITISGYNSLDSKNWRRFLVPNLPPIPQIIRPIPDQQLPVWPTSEELTQKLTVYWRALIDACEAFQALTPDQQNGVKPLP